MIRLVSGRLPIGFVQRVPWPPRWRLIQRTALSGDAVAIVIMNDRSQLVTLMIEQDRRPAYFVHSGEGIGLTIPLIHRSSAVECGQVEENRRAAALLPDQIFPQLCSKAHTLEIVVQADKNRGDGTVRLHPAIQIQKC